MYNYIPPATEPVVLYADNDMLIVDKPAGLLSVPGRRPEHRDCLISRLQNSYPGSLIVHRLDMDTSGLMVIAGNAAALRNLSRQFEQRQVKKSYLAVVNGLMEQTAGRIDLPLIGDWPNRPRQKVDTDNGKPATTDFRLLASDPQSDSSRVELQPLTGRTHQLRVHMQALGHPILGDDLYADMAAAGKADRLLLHASTLELSHPTRGEALTFYLEAPF